MIVITPQDKIKDPEYFELDPMDYLLETGIIDYAELVKIEEV